MKLLNTLFKRLFIGILLLIGCSDILRAQVIDDFGDGDFTANPTWIGMTDSFEVSSGLLRTKTGEAGNLYLSTSSTVQPTSWEFFFRMAFNPSAQNYVEVWLMADNADLNEAQNGYFVRLGGNSTDGIGLFKKVGGTATELILQSGNTLLAGPSNNFGNLKITRSGNGSWEISEKIINQTFTSIGTITDNSLTATSFMGVRIVTTKTNRSRHYFDDFNVSASSGPDLIPPVFLSANAQTATEIDLGFNEAVDETFSTQLSNYAISPSATILSAIRQPGNFSTIRLTLAEALTAGSYTVTVNQCKDLAGNTETTAQNRIFTYSPVVPITYRSVVINEIMAAPSNNAGTSVPQVEWIELHNPGTSPITLTDWTIRDGSTAAPKVIPTTTLAAGGFVVLTSSSNATQFDGLAPIAAVTLPALNNDKDSLVLADNNGFPVDVVFYQDTWYQDPVKKSGGYTLEQINPKLPCSGAFNWIGANFPEGGSPGSINTAYSDEADQIPPSLILAELVNGNTIRLTFSEPISAESLPLDSFKIEGLTFTNIQVRVPKLESITLTLSESIQLGQIYDLSIFGVKDCAGNPAGQINTSIGKGKAPARFDLLITEIQSDNSPDNQLPQAEYIELYNATDVVIDLAGCALDAGTSTNGKFPPFLLKPGQYAVACGTSFTGLFSGANVIGVTSFPALSQDGAKLTLKNAAGNWIHQMHYTSKEFSPASLLNSGWSLELIDPSNVCDQKSNWAVSTDPKGGTPGKANSVLSSKPDLSSPILVKAVVVGPTTVKVTWNELIDSSTLATLPISLPTGFQIISQEIPASDYSSLQFSFSPALEPNQTLSISLGVIRDCAGNTSEVQSISIALPGKADASSWCLNEILYNPRTGGADYVELKNISDRYLDLKELQIGNKSDKAPLVSESAVIAPGGFALLTSSANLTMRDYPRGKAETFTETSLPSFNSDSGTVRIWGPGNVIWQQFFYSDKIQVGILDDTKGVSLERISCDLPVNQASSWHSASKDAGYGTPGYENSQSRSINPDDAFTADPKTFSPNGDGNKDFTIFTYDQSKNGLIGNLRIYSADGFLVRNLAESANLGSRGFWQWDGTTEEGRKARMGMYVAVLETIELGGDVKYYRIPVAIAAER